MQLSEFVLLDEIAVVSSLLTANTTRIPPEVVVNAWVTLIVHGITVPDVRLLLSNVIVASFLVTFPAGLASEPVFGTM